MVAWYAAISPRRNATGLADGYCETGFPCRVCCVRRGAADFALLAFFSGGSILAVRISSIVLRVAVILELALGVSLWIARPLAPVLLHMALGLLIVALVWFLGLAQATVKGGSLG